MPIALKGPIFGMYRKSVDRIRVPTPGLHVILSPLLFIIGARKAIQELLFREIGRLAHQVLLMGLQRDLGHFAESAG